jgi:hypothetical protein
MARRVVDGGGRGHDVPNEFSGERNTGNTPSTPSTPSTPTSHITGTQYAGKASRRWGRNLSDALQSSLANNPNVSENLELAYEGDDSKLLPIKTASSNPRRPRTTAAG